MPGWLRAIGANAMPLGLDLQGGVHFLMEVDQKAALDKMQQTLSSTTSARRCARRISATIDQRGAAGHRRHAAFGGRSQGAGNIIAKEVNQPEKLGAQPPLELIDGHDPRRQFRADRQGARDRCCRSRRAASSTSNLTTLRNRVNQLGVSEPIIQQQGANRIVVELPGVQDTAEAKKILGATATLEYRAVDEAAVPRIRVRNREDRQRAAGIASVLREQAWRRRQAAADRAEQESHRDAATIWSTPRQCRIRRTACLRSRCA